MQNKHQSAFLSSLPRSASHADLMSATTQISIFIINKLKIIIIIIIYDNLTEYNIYVMQPE